MTQIHGRRSHRWRRAARRPLASLVFAAVLALAIAMPVLAASPGAAVSPAPEPSVAPGILGTGDPRSNGQGPGLVGSPFAVALGVVVLGVLAAGGTLLYVRLTRSD